MERDAEKPPADHDKDDPTHDAAAAPMWAVYVSEAEKYDRSLVESWKSDMEGMLIFAGLFSASLTAFLIESYKTLTPDPGDTTAIILAQISLQLAASANGTKYHVPSPTPFTTPASSLVCNVLWFISLGLSLTCALIATLLEQWARDLLHRADMRSAPVIRARVFSFLYYGLKRFRMHTVVEIIPLLLHASLLLFFIGLIAFLIPVNIAVMAVVTLILLTVTTVYALLTVLPLLHLDCPYRTPLSGGLWRLRQELRRVLPRWRSRSPMPTESADEGMVESVFRTAMEYSEERSKRDQNALVWTVQSLADDNELEPFIEAIPDVIWAPKSSADVYGNSPDAYRRYVYDDHMRRLMNDPRIILLRRLHAFGDTCYRGILAPEVRKRRQIALYKAVWALGCLSTPGQLPFRLIRSHWEERADPEVCLYHSSAVCMQRWANLCAAQNLLDETSRQLMICKRAILAKQSPDKARLSEMVLRLHSEYGLLYFTPLEPFPRLIELSHIETWMEDIRVLPLDTYLVCLAWAAHSESRPYRFNTTLSLVTPTLQILPSNGSIRRLRHDLDWMIDMHLDLFTTEEQPHWLDEIFALMLSHFEPPDSDDTRGVAGMRLPSGVVTYLAVRKSSEAVSRAIKRLPSQGWKCIPGTILL
ncbi:hypothetical protein DFH06DRAFT_189829, partial [Mycena polygramma]